MKPMNRLQSRQENQNRRRLKAAGFPYLKTMEEFDCSQLNDAVSPVFLNELASCQFISGRQNVVMIGNPGQRQNTSFHSPWTKSLYSGLQRAV